MKTMKIGVMTKTQKMVKELKVKMKIQNKHNQNKMEKTKNKKINKILIKFEKAQAVNL